MTHKSRIYAPIDGNPLPEHSCSIDIKLSCGSTLTRCYLFQSGDILFSAGYSDTLIDKSLIKSWRLTK